MFHSLHNLKVSQKIKSKINFDALVHIKDNFHIPLVMKKKKQFETDEKYGMKRRERELSVP
jgi:hypothetical protein